MVLQSVRNHLLYSELFAKAFPFKQPPILLLSYPRSGSSWIGKVLSLSPDIAYLREPINQPLQQRLNGKASIDSVFDPDYDEQTRECYTRFADQAIAGIPPRQVADVIDTVADFYPWRRRSKHLLIKEVNPLAAGFFLRRYSLKVLILLRHPAAVAESFKRLGWLEDKFEEFGYLYGNHLAQAIAACANTVILYEEFAKEPVHRFRNLLSSLDLRCPAAFEESISEFCENDSKMADPYELRRMSLREIGKWKQNLNRTEIDAVRKGYSLSSLGYYRDEKEWD